MKKLLALLVILGVSAIANSQVPYNPLTPTTPTVGKTGPTINTTYNNGVASSTWNFSITDTPANLLTAVPTLFTQVSTVVTADASIIATTQTAILAKLTTANNGAATQLVTVTVNRYSGATTPTYTVVTVW